MQNKQIIPHSQLINQTHNSPFQNANELNMFINASTYHVILNLIVKIIFSVIGLIILLYTIMTITKDINKEMLKREENEKKKINQCIKNYNDNNCDSENMVPALKDYCQENKDCFSYSPYGVGKSKIATRYIAQLLNELFNTMSSRTIGSLAIIVGIISYLYYK